MDWEMNSTNATGANNLGKEVNPVITELNLNRNNFRFTSAERFILSHPSNQIFLYNNLTMKNLSLGD